MKLKEFDIRLDIKRSQKHDYIEVVQGDYETNILNIQITENLQPYNLTGLTVEAVFAKPDRTTVLQDMDNGVAIVDPVQGKIKITLKTNTIAAPGTVQAEVRILDGDMLLTTARFKFFVRQAIMSDETIKSTNEFPVLTKLVEDVAQVQEDFPAIQQFFNDVQSVEQARVEAENIRQQQESVRQSNESIRQSNEQNRIAAETERQSNESIRQSNEATRQASITDIENRWNTLTTAQQQEAEVINARTSTTKGKTFPSLNDRIEEIEADTHKAKTTPEIYNTASIFSVGVGTDSQGSPLDYSESIVKGQVSVTVKGNTETDEEGNTKSTISAMRIKSVGKNLFDGKLEAGGIATSTGKPYVVENQVRSVNYIKVNDTVCVSRYDNSLGVLAYVYDENKNYLGYRSNINGNRTYIPITMFPAMRYIKLVLMNTTDLSTPVQVEIGELQTLYEPYRESNAYVIAKDEEGNIVELRSLPNGTKDEINVTDRKLIKRIGEKSNIANGMEIDFADMAVGGTYYAWNEDGETETGIKGDTLGIDATTLIYQLAQPIEIPIEAEGTLEGYPGGTVYIEPYIADTSQYNSGITLPKPVTQIDKIKGFVDNEWKELSNSYTLSPDGLTLTIDGITNGQYIKVYAPIKPEESTIPTTAMQFPCNLKAQVEGNMKLANKANLRIDELDDFVTAMLLNHEMRITLLEGGSL